MDFKDFFKNRLRTLRKELGETQTQAAKAVGVSGRYYQNLELGENLPGIECFIALADHFGVSLDYLLCRTDDPAGSAPQPEGQLVLNGWMPGGTFPREPCEVVADFCVGGENHIRQVCIYDQGNFYFRAKGSNGAEIEAEIIRWMWLAPIEENR